MFDKKRHKIIFKQITFVSILILVINSCAVDNQIYFDLKENNFQINHSASRDFNDIPFFIPNNLNQWEITEFDNLKLNVKRIFDYNNPVVSLFSLDSIPENETINTTIINPNYNNQLLLKEPLSVSSQNYFIYSTHKIKMIFKNRKVRAHYDKLFNYYSGFYDSIISDEKNIASVSEPKNNLEDIVNQLVGYLFLEVINRSNIEFNKKGIYLNALKSWPNKINLSEKISYETPGLKVDNILNILLEAQIFLQSIIDQEYKAEVELLWKELEFDVFVTHLLLFNNFTIKASLPGELINHNADSIYFNDVFWNISINDFINNDEIIYAESRTIHKKNILIILSVLFFIFILFIKNKIKLHQDT